MHRRALLLACCLPAPAQAQARALALSPSNTTIRFAIGALGLFTLEGRFTRFAGVLVLDPARPDATEVAVMVDTTSVQAEGGSADAARERDLLKTRDFPVMTYRSARVTPGAASGEATLDGLLTLAGITRPLALQVRGDAAGFAATGELERSAHGLTALRPILADRARLSIAVRLAAG